MRHGSTGTPARPGTISAAVAQSLREEISEGLLAPGTPLRQIEIAQRYGVSTTPVREAFVLLEQEGVVTKSDHKGVVVFEPTIDDLREVYLIRIPLEVVATEHAVPNLDEDKCAELRSIIDEMVACTEAGDRGGRADANRRFHQTIYEAAGLPRLFALIEELRTSSLAYIQLFGVFHPDFTAAIEEHRRIVDACERGDAKAAAALMGEHLESTARVVAAGLAKLRPPES